MSRTSPTGASTRSSGRPSSQSSTRSCSGRYHAHERPELVRQVDPGAGRVLDLGCGEGRLAAAIRRDRGAREIWGVEVAEGAAREAERSGALDRVLCGDLEALVDELPRDYFTHVVAGDVLEHLVDPWTVLAKLRLTLQPGGRFICSLPNIRNLSFLLKLFVLGRFEYKDEGVMDRTHLRFFARRDVELLFEGAGFEDVRIGPVRPKRSRFHRALRSLAGDLLVKGFLVTAVRADGGDASDPPRSAERPAER